MPAPDCANDGVSCGPVCALVQSIGGCLIADKESAEETGGGVQVYTPPHTERLFSRNYQYVLTIQSNWRSRQNGAGGN
jgi:hypothetical protein